jgi:hypothetical protein
MHKLKNGYGEENMGTMDIVVEWKYGAVKGFGSREEAQRFINNVCKRTAPDMEYSVSLFMFK